MGTKTKIYAKRDHRALKVSSFDLSRKNKRFLSKECQNQMKIDRVMSIRRSRAKVAVGLYWAESCLFWPQWCSECRSTRLSTAKALDILPTNGGQCPAVGLVFLVNVFITVYTVQATLLYRFAK